MSNGRIIFDRHLTSAFTHSKSHNPSMTYNSEAVRLRRFKQRKEDYFSSLNQLNLDMAMV